MKPPEAEVIKSGTWMYNDTLSSEVWIFRQKFEYHFEEGTTNRGPVLFSRNYYLPSEDCS